jgi:hypothetical protein
MKSSFISLALPKTFIYHGISSQSWLWHRRRYSWFKAAAKQRIAFLGSVPLLVISVVRRAGLVGAEQTMRAVGSVRMQYKASLV